jgi:hypothetical protein
VAFCSSSNVIGSRRWAPRSRGSTAAQAGVPRVQCRGAPAARGAPGRRYHGDTCRAAALVVLMRAGAGALAVLLGGGLLPSLCSCVLGLVSLYECHDGLPARGQGCRVGGCAASGPGLVHPPAVEWSDLAPLIGGALGISLVALADTISTSSSFADRRGEEVDGNREMVGLGAANLAAGLFQGFPVCTSGSRTAVAEQSGSKTQVTGLVGAVVITLMLMLFLWLLQSLPQPMLAAVVIAASVSLADVPDARRLCSQSRSEFILSMTASPAPPRVRPAKAR